MLIGSRIILRDISTKSIVTQPDRRSGPPIHITNAKVRMHDNIYSGVGTCLMTDRDNNSIKDIRMQAVRLPV
jgi:hypothetical protein